MKNTISTILLLVALSAFSQNETIYPDQNYPGLIPQIFAPGIVSSEAHEFSCSMTPDGKEFYFTRRNPELRINQIMVTKYIDGSWTDPGVVSFTGNSMAFEPRVTPDGNRLYFTYEKAVPGQSGPPMNIWYVEREEKGWGEPQNPGHPFNPLRTMYISMTEKGDIYTSDVSQGPSNEAVAVIRNINGKYGEIERLGSPVNMKKQDMYPYITPDESILLFTSRRDRTDRSTDIFASFKTDEGKWSNPQK
ncbi:hypothetical protein ACFLRY_04620, partial [Bacteroidota bacterium]